MPAERDVLLVADVLSPENQHAVPVGRRHELRDGFCSKRLSQIEAADFGGKLRVELFDGKGEKRGHLHAIISSSALSRKAGVPPRLGRRSRNSTWTVSLGRKPGRNTVLIVTSTFWTNERC